MNPTAGSPDEKCSRSDFSTSNSNLKMQEKDLDVAFARNFHLLCSDECVIMLFIMTLHIFISRLQAVLQSKQCPGQDLEVGLGQQKGT